jgi:peroxiredoxin
VKAEWARRTTFVVDKQGLIQHIDEGRDAVNPNTAVTVCTTLDSKAKS